MGKYSGKKANVTLVIDKFVGGGFAGQVYRVKITKIESSEQVESLKVVIKIQPLTTMIKFLVSLDYEKDGLDFA